MSRRSATIRDVAREAGVSVASVSRALNGQSNVTEATRARVRAAATLLGYVPHVGARNLSLARSGAIGVVLPDLHGEFFSEVLRGLDRGASAHGFQLLLSNMHVDSQLSAAAIGAMHGRVDGLVVMAPHLPPDLLAEMLPPNLPAVVVNPVGDVPAEAQIVRVDNVAAAREMTEHLIDIGKRNIVHLRGPHGNIESDLRERGYRDAMEAAGLPTRVIDGDFTEEGGIAAARIILADRQGADGVFAANDLMAIGVIPTLRDAGVKVPEEVAVGGFDDTPLARLVTPALTTMRIEMVGLGLDVIDRLVRLMESGEPEAPCLRLPALVVRQTTSATHA